MKRHGSLESCASGTAESEACAATCMHSTNVGRTGAQGVTFATRCALKAEQPHQLSGARKMRASRTVEAGDKPSALRRPSRLNAKDIDPWMQAE